MTTTACTDSTAPNRSTTGRATASSPAETTIVERPGQTATARARPETAIRTLARRQHGIVARRQLLAAGVSPDVVDRRLDSGWLHRIHRGVYQVGPVQAARATEMAACLACGPSAVVSHRSAAALWDVLPPALRTAVVEVTVRGGPRRHRGIRAHRSRTLRDAEVTTVNGIPVTKPGRTIFNLASALEPRQLERVVAEAISRRLNKPARLRRIVARYEGQAGAPTLLAVLEGGRPALTRSEAQERFLALVRRARLDPPTANTIIEDCEVDFLWRDAGLIVEIDGFAFHSSRKSFEDDRRRDAILIAAGYRVVRVTWRQLAHEPEAVLVRLAGALTAGRPPRR